MLCCSYVGNGRKLSVRLFSHELDQVFFMIMVNSGHHGDRDFRTKKKMRHLGLGFEYTGNGNTNYYLMSI